MLLRRMVTAKKYPSLDASFMTSGLSENSFGNSLSVANTATVNRIPKKVDVTTATITANFAAFGWPAPSKLETRTLQNKEVEVLLCILSFTWIIIVLLIYV